MKNRDKLIRDAEKINVFLDVFHVKQFEKYEEILLEWNEKINLTTITDEDEIITKHFVDSLYCAKYMSGNEKIIDIGTGAGFPGIPLKIIFSNINLTLLDSLNKRCIYLKDVAEKLKMENVDIVHGRAEELGKDIKYREKFDIITARAVANMKVLSEYCIPFAKVGGKFICMKGSEYKDELNDARAQIGTLGGKVTDIEEIVLPDSDIKHSIIVIEKVRETPREFPRRKIK